MRWLSVLKNVTGSEANESDKSTDCGFCFGVKRAVDQVYDLAAKKRAGLHLRADHPQRRGSAGSGRKGVQVLNGKKICFR